MPYEFEQPVLDLRGGTVTKVPAFLMDDNQTRLTQGFRYFHGHMEKESGFSGILSTVPNTGRVRALYKFYDGYSSSYLMGVWANNGLYRSSGNRMAQIGSGYSSAITNFATANRKVYIANNDRGAFTGWSGNKANNAFVATGPAEAPTFVIYHQEANRLFAARGDTNVQRVWFSDINAFETWPTNNFIDIPESRVGDRVSGFGRLHGRLVIFGEHTISVLYGRTPSDFQLRTLDWNIGLRHFRSLAEFDGYLCFVNASGIYMFDGSGPAQRISDPIDDIFRSLSTTLAESINIVGYRNTDDHYVVSYPSVLSSANQDRELVCIPPGGQHAGWRFAGPHKKTFSSYLALRGGDDGRKAYAGHASNGQVYQLETGKDYGGNPIEAVLETKQYHLNAPFIRKTFKELEVHIESDGQYALEVRYKVDGESAWRMLGAVNLSKTGPVYGDKDATQVQRGRAVHPLMFSKDDPAIGNYIEFQFRNPGKKAKREPIRLVGFVIRANRWKAGIGGD